MTGFNYKNENGSFEIWVRKGYTGNEQESWNFAREYWRTVKPIVLYVGPEVNLPQTLNDIKGKIMMVGVEKFMPREIIRPGDERTPDVENLNFLLHTISHQAVYTMSIKPIQS